MIAGLACWQQIQLSYRRLEPRQGDITPSATVSAAPAQNLTTPKCRGVRLVRSLQSPFGHPPMHRIQHATAEIVQLRTASRSLTFSREERQALLVLTYAVPGTAAVIAADDHGDEYCSLGAADFQEGAWWTVLVTANGFDVVNFAGYRVRRFAAIGPLVECMRPHMGYMLGTTIVPNDREHAAGSQATPRRFLTVV